MCFKSVEMVNLGILLTLVTGKLAIHSCFELKFVNWIRARKRDIN